MDTKTIELCANWKFHRGECEEAWYKGYSDDSWRRVMIPHDWSVEEPFSEKNVSGTGYLAGGIGWYRTHFCIPEEYRGKRVRLAFDGVYKNSQVFCNSYYLGKRPNGYVPFSYDITDRVYFGDRDNVVSVKVDHTDLADSRWFTGSGITRKVYLMIEEPVHPQEYGCTFRTVRITEEQGERKGEVEISHEAVNTGSESVHLTIRTTLTDADGQIVMEEEGRTELPAGGYAAIRLCGTVADPRLWSPEMPYLYRMKTWYQIGEGSAYLTGEEQVGIRTIAFDPQRGFFLNQKETKLKGVCVHHDGGCLGAAMQSEVWQRRLALLKECGCNAIRCSHNPHMPELYALCDSMGFLVMDEAFDEWENAKNKWAVGHNVYPPRHQGYYEDFPAWHDQDLRAMVRRDRNHPSVILWSIGNEIDYPNDPYCHPMFTIMTGNNDANKPEAERQYDPDKPNMERLAVLAAQLSRIVRQEDKARPVTVAAAFPELSSRVGFFDELDVVGYNYKEQLYEEDHARFPDKALLGSENGHSYQAWRAVTDHPYICGQFLWTGIDYLGEAKGWPVHGSPAGLLTTAGLPKPEYYRRKTFWKDELVMKLVTRKCTTADETENVWGLAWNYQAQDRVEIACYTNFGRLCAQRDACVVLLCNGREIGKKEVWQEEDGFFSFETEYESGVLEALCYDADGKCMGTCRIATTGGAAALQCHVWREPDLLHGETWEKSAQRTGYLYQIVVELVDEQGRKTTWDDREVRVQIQGAGRLAGMDNGDLADVTPFTADRKKTYRGELVVYVKRTEPGEVRAVLSYESGGETGCSQTMVLP